MNNRVKKIAILVLKIILTLGIIGLDIYLLYRYDYINNFNQVDNALGYLPISLIIIISGLLVTLIWIRYSKSMIPSISVLVVFAIGLSVFFPFALTGNIWLTKPVKNVGKDGDITIYAPFKEDTKAVRLEEESTLKLTSDMPVMDGALALYPLYSSFGQTIYDEEKYNGEIQFRNTLRGFNALVDGEVDIFFSSYPSKKQIESAKEKGVELTYTPIGREAFVFVVAKSNPINNLTVQQIHNIYSGKTSNWATLGWKEGGQMIKYQRPEGSGSQSGIQSIMKGLPLQVAQPLPSNDLIGTNSLMDQISVTYKGVQPAIGYTYRFFGINMNPNSDSKFLSINGISPTSENIQNGSYPYIAKFYAITTKKPEGNVKKVIDWILSPQGQDIVEKTGYSKI